MNIQFFKDEMPQEWDCYVTSVPHGTFFHLSGWRRVIVKTFGYPSFYLFAEEGGKIRGILPLFLVKRLFSGSFLCSVPFGVYGGVCADDAAVEHDLLKRGSEILAELGTKYIEFRHVEKSNLDLPVKDLYVTFEREIYADPEQNMEANPRKQRRMIRQGAKHGLTSIMGGEEFLPQFYDIYAQSLRNLGTPVFPYAYFRNLVEEFGDLCRILTVWHRDKMAAAVMTFFYKERVIPYYGGSLKECLRYAVNDFMYWELMQYGCEKGYKIFDFGRSRKGTGSFDFKRHWGFEPKPLSYQYYLPKGGQVPNISPSNTKFRLFISIWKRLPLPITKVIGPRILRYLP